MQLRYTFNGLRQGVPGGLCKRSTLAKLVFIIS